MAEQGERLMPATGEMPSDKQRIFARYLFACLIDLVVLSLFAEYWDKVFVDTFTTALLASVLLVVLLKITLAIEHKVAAFFNARPGGFNKFMRYFTAWLIIFGSKFVILEALAVSFGKNVHFEGVFHGIVTLIVVVLTMLVAEELIVRFYRKLA